MKRKICVWLVLFIACFTNVAWSANEPDSVYVFAYGTNKGDGSGGLYFAWSLDQNDWRKIGSNDAFLNSDFGSWGSQKRMYDPVLIRDGKGIWHCLWTLNDEVNAVAHTVSTNLTYWKPQSYPYLRTSGNCQHIEVKYDTQADHFILSWEDTKVNPGFYATTTKDFKHFGNIRTIGAAQRMQQRREIELGGEKFTGTVHKVSWKEVDHLIGSRNMAAYKRSLNEEKMADDGIRFAGLGPLEATISIQPERSKKISNMLIGAFFEDINYAADGGLYAELVRNRDFEFSSKDRAEWDAKTAWAVNGNGLDFTIGTEDPIHINNTHYAVLDIREAGAGIINEGYGGISLKKGESYNFSLFARKLAGQNGNIKIRLTGANGEVYSEATIKSISSGWKKYQGTLKASETVTSARLEVISQQRGKLALDMVSLFPQQTFKGRKNGMRNDLAQALADMKPRFVRFPGGCVAHGDGIDNIYNWKNTIGPLESRKQDRNLWGYHQSMGLGYYEYFQLCEDIGAEPVPVLAAGVPCQNSSRGGHGQQCGIPMEEMEDYIQDILDLIEWANGDPKKSKWAKMRADAGHSEPFGLKYIGIGNEDLISDVFEERFAMICTAIQKKYPEINIIGTAGPFYEGSDYTEGWRVSTEAGVQLVDEHYYVPPGWFIHNQDFYDRYDRSRPKVYLGEYAAHLPGRPNNIETALTEALHLANIERNGDIVSMTSYAPLLAKEGNTQWNPNLIYFTNTEVHPTVGYYVQQLYGQHSGDEYIPTLVRLSESREDVGKRVACSVVKDSSTGDIIVKLINLLPSEVKVSVQLEELKRDVEQVQKIELSGKPGDKNANPVNSVVRPEELSGIRLVPYSFTVLRFK